MAATHQTARHLVRALRRERGWTQEQLAEKAGLDYKYYQLFESGHTESPSLRLIEALAAVLGMKAWVLLCDDPVLLRKLTGISPDALAAKRKPGRPKSPARPETTVKGRKMAPKKRKGGKRKTGGEGRQC